MARISEDWSKRIKQDLDSEYISGSLTQFGAFILVIVGIIASLTGGGMLLGIALIFSAIPIFMTANLTSDNRKQRIVLEYILKLQQQQVVYLNDIKNAVEPQRFEIDFPDW